MVCKDDINLLIISMLQAWCLGFRIPPLHVPPVENLSPLERLQKGCLMVTLLVQSETGEVVGWWLGPSAEGGM